MVTFVVNIRDKPDAIKKIIENLHVSIQTSLANDIGKAGNFAVETGQRVAHVQTGHLRKNIQLQTVNKNEVKVLSKAIYSGYENKRKYSGALGSVGPHNFFDQMYDATKKKFSGTVVMSNIIDKHRSKII